MVLCHSTRKVTKTSLKGQDVACHKLGFAKADTEVGLGCEVCAFKRLLVTVKGGGGKAEEAKEKAGLQHQLNKATRPEPSIQDRVSEACHLSISSELTKAGLHTPSE